jgi:hypothetical protein
MQVHRMEPHEQIEADISSVSKYMLAISIESSRMECAE